MSAQEPDPSGTEGDAGQTGAEQADPARFDEVLGELERLVETLEQGDLSLEDSLAHFERGIGLARECRESLQSAEQQVQILLERDADDPGDADQQDSAALGDFDPDPDTQ